MSAKLFTLEIYSPRRTFFKGEVESLTVETASGRRGFLAGAAAMTCLLKTGTIEILHNKKWSEAMNTNGFLFVHKDGITLFCDKCRWPHEAEHTEDSSASTPTRSYKATKISLAEKLMRE